MSLHPRAEDRAAGTPYRDAVTDHSPAPSLLSPAVPEWVGRGARVAVLAAVIVSVVTSIGPRSPAVTGAASAALVVAVGGSIAAAVLPRESRGSWLAMVAIGLAGAALSGLTPGSIGFLLVYLALISLGIADPPRRALAGAIIVFAAMVAAVLAAGGQSLAALASQASGAAFFFAVAAFLRSSRLAADRAQAAQARAEALLEQLRASQAALAQTAALAERARLAREIHDVLAHTLTGLVLALDTMELLGRQADPGPEVVEQMLEQVARGQRIAREGLADTKRAIAALRGDELPGPGLLDRLVRETASATGLRAEFCVIGEPADVSPEIGLTLYRTAQEALTNSAKHAGAGAWVRLQLRYDGDMVELSVDDERAQGVAAGRESGFASGGFGLTGMRERAELMGGSLVAGPTERGFSLRLRLPSHPGPDQAMAGSSAPRPAAAGPAGGAPS
jgi:signal transduction histidine kinase